MARDLPVIISAANAVIAATTITAYFKGKGTRIFGIADRTDPIDFRCVRTDIAQRKHL
jgi:hypothetical protein